MEQENAKAIQILGKVVVKLQELVKELEASAPPLPPVVPQAPDGTTNAALAPQQAAPTPTSAGLFGLGNILGFGNKQTNTNTPPRGGKAKKSKKAKKGGDAVSSMVYNTSDLMKGVSSSLADATTDARVTSLQFMPQPFSAGNNFSLSGIVSDTLSSTQMSDVTPVISGGKKKSQKARKPKH
jgi:hypothetical protein